VVRSTTTDGVRSASPRQQNTKLHSIPDHEQSRGGWEYQGWWETFRPLYVPQGKDIALDSKLAHTMDLRIRDNVCFGKGNGDFPGNIRETSPTEREAVEGLLSMKAFPSDYSGPVVPGAVVIITLHHLESYAWRNIEHLAEAVLPIFDTLSLLDDHGLISDMPIKSVLYHQAGRRNMSIFQETDWLINVIKLLGKEPNNTQVFLWEDLVDTSLPDPESRAVPICAKHAIILDRKTYSGGAVQRQFFSDTRNAFRFKEKAFIALGLPNKMLHRPPSRVASMIVRSDRQGIRNQEEINMELKRYLTERCWHLRVVPPFEKPMHLKDQVALFARTDLSISVHGAHLTNLIWQPIGSGVLIIEKCGFKDNDFSALAMQSGIAVYRSRQTSCQSSRMVTQPYLPRGKHFHKILKAYSPNFETDLKPALDEALTDMESMYYRGPGCSEK